MCPTTVRLELILIISIPLSSLFCSFSYINLKCILQFLFFPRYNLNSRVSFFFYECFLKYLLCTCSYVRMRYQNGCEDQALWFRRLSQEGSEVQSLPGQESEFKGQSGQVTKTVKINVERELKLYVCMRACVRGSVCLSVCLSVCVCVCLRFRPHC